jgi:protein-S-isoprenylcysteine O-methyltransferase Ste14
MVRRSIRKRLRQVVHERYVTAVYTIASGLLLMTLVVFWQRVAPEILVPPMWVRWLLRAAALAAVAGIFWGILALGSLDPFGLGPIRDHLRDTRTPPQPFTIRGPYRWVRHPLYFFYLVIIWGFPIPTIDRLLFNTLWTVWIVVGTVLEERDLVLDFGETYRSYQRRVPMLIPRRLRPAPASGSQDEDKR